MTIDIIPSAPNRQDITNFSSQTDLLFQSIPQYITQFNTSEQSSLTNSATAITNTADIATNMSSVETLSINATSRYDDFDDRYLGYSIGGDPTVDHDGNPLLTGAVGFLNTTTKVFDGTQWLAADSYSSAVTSTNDLLTINSNRSQLNNYYLNAIDSEYYFSLKYMEASSSNPYISPSSWLGQNGGVMYWNTTYSEMRFLINTSTDWKSFTPSGVLPKSGGTITGGLNVTGVVRADNLVVTGGFHQLASQAFPTTSRKIVSETQIKQNFDWNFVLPGDTEVDLPFATTPNIRFVATANKILKCTTVPPAGVRCTLIIVTEDPNPGISRTYTFGLHIRDQGDAASFTGSGSPYMIIRFVSNGSTLVEIDRIGPL